MPSHTLAHTLDPVAIRVLGALVEKELSTPDHYPLSLNALTSACNQSSNRDPVMALDEDTVMRTLDALRRQGLVRSFQGIGSRVPKFQHLLTESIDLSRAELAVWCVLALRGAQTMAEVRSRAARLTTDDADGIEAALEALIVRDPMPVAVRLPRRPGQKEVRYAQLLGGDVVFDVDDVLPADSAVPAMANSGATTTSASIDRLSADRPAADRLSADRLSADRLSALEETVRELRREVDDVREQLAAFRKQFE